MKNFRLGITICIGFLMMLSVDTLAQLPGPGAKRDLASMQELERGSVLLKDSVSLVDTIIVYDAETFVETMTIVKSTYSIFDYCQHLLGVENPNDLLNGAEMTISNPDTYLPMKIRWNASAGKIDTIR